MSVERLITTDELLAAEGTMLYDVESYLNYFIVSFLHYESGKICFFEIHEDTQLQVDWIKWILRRFCIVGFNSIDYDIVVLSYAISREGVTPLELKQLTNKLIQDNERSHDLQKEYGFEIFPANHIDLIEVAPLSASLKTYAARLHCKHMQDLPYPHDAVLSREEKNHVRTYNFNDLDNTKLLLSELSPHLDLRAKLSMEFSNDLRSLSDAQLAQEIINSELKRVTGRYPRRPNYKNYVGTFFLYEPPSYIKFQTPQLQNMLADIVQAEIFVGDTGHVKCPTAIEGRKIIIDNRTYTIGMGGLHSNEKSQALIANEDNEIKDRDVTGYYPNLILKNKFAPKHLGEAFLEALQNIVDRRYKAKKEGVKVTADSLKIASNGVFGKTSDPYSTVYDPKMMVQTTLTGQLSLLMAIEALTLFGFSVVSANTDGIVTLVPSSRYYEFCTVFKAWEQQTGLETEETDYKALYSRDVNNYIAIKPDDTHKVKGVYSEVGSALNSPLSKNPENLICTDAVIAHITKGTPIEQTIMECTNIKRFVAVRKVAGGAQKDGRYLGKTIRWYYAIGIKGTINYATNGNKVSLSDGAKPCMLLPDTLPNDIDYAKYIEIATGILEDIGYMPRRLEQYKML